jgi:hypothetical protein
MSEDKILKDCNFCRFANELTEEIPYWSKKRENYSPYPKMVSCDENYSLKNESLKSKYPNLDDNSLEFKLTLGSDNSEKWVFYWASSKQEDITTINPPETAYGDYENHGLQQCNSKGEIIVKINQPQPYKEVNKTHCRHFHYILEGPDKVWLPLKTVRVICTIPIEYLDARIKEMDCMIINALPKESYDKEKIPKSVNLCYKSLDRLTKESKERNVKKFLKLSLKEYPKLNELVKSDKLDLKDIPIITYCTNDKCDASSQLIDHLYESGVNNTLEWASGMEGWNKKRTFFEQREPSTEGSEDESDEGSDESDEGSEDESSSDDESDLSEDEEMTFKEIEHEGIEYSYIGDTLYDSYLDPIGKVKIIDSKIVEMDEKVTKYHSKKKKPEMEKPEMEKPEVIESPKKKSKKEGKESEETFTRGSLEGLKGGKKSLQSIVKQISSREASSYDYGDIKNMNKNELVNIALVCQGKKKTKATKTDYKYRTNKEINEMNEDDLREMLNEMIGRDPETYKYTESDWSKPKLVDFILQCHGSSRPREFGVKLFIGGGWAL